MGHVVLLGDSIFDNGAYVRGGPDVVRQLRGKLPANWDATLLAVDGAVTREVREQLARLPRDATHLVVSAGGNDALGRAGILEERARSAAEVFGRLADIGEEFGAAYREMLRAVLSAGLPAAFCTIYHPRFPDRLTQRLAVAALATFNDVIVREVVAAGAPLLDLRLICDQDSDYANPIEPSASGGAKIAAAILRLI